MCKNEFYLAYLEEARCKFKLMSRFENSVWTIGHPNIICTLVKESKDMLHGKCENVVTHVSYHVCMRQLISLTLVRSLLIFV